MSASLQSAPSAVIFDPAVTASPPRLPPVAATVSTAEAFEHWLSGARRGEIAVYHVGHIGADRVEPGPRGEQVAALADTVYLHSDLDTPHISACYHIRGWTPGRRQVELVQLRATGGRTVYLAKRKVG